MLIQNRHPQGHSLQIKELYIFGCRRLRGKTQILFFHIHTIFKNIYFDRKPYISNIIFKLKNSSTCSQYTEALSSSKPKVARSCAQMDEAYDNVIFDTTIREDSVVTSFGFTCDSHHTTEV